MVLFQLILIIFLRILAICNQKERRTCDEPKLRRQETPVQVPGWTDDWLHKGFLCMVYNRAARLWEKS